ncbi:histidine-tRNA ligase/ATP phosphoribosyltransferase regulatory subunit, partial [Kipferlia bialata]|eukprot:g6013.t1
MHMMALPFRRAVNAELTAVHKAKAAPANQGMAAGIAAGLKNVIAAVEALHLAVTGDAIPTPEGGCGCAVVRMGEVLAHIIQTSTEALAAVEAAAIAKRDAAIARMAKPAGEGRKPAKQKKNKKEKKAKRLLNIGMGTEAVMRHVLALFKGEDGVLAVPSPMMPNVVSSLATFVLKDIIQAAEARRKPKVARGTRDMTPAQMAVRQYAINKVSDVFKRHGAVSIDTPVFELRSTLLGKYGDDGAKLVYNLADQGGEQLSLRYDLTVPFARYVAMHGISKIKRYHIAKVYRRDNPVMTKGRFREFFQCDFDIAGESEGMLPDGEVLCVIVEILRDLPLGDFEVKINHRLLLDATLDICGVPASRFRQVCASIDKLDKCPWSEVREEIIQRGIHADVADRIYTLINHRGPVAEVLADIERENTFGDHAGAQKALSELTLLSNYLSLFGVADCIKLDLSLARGLDYYTGLVFEAVCDGGVGSISGGGRYDNLVGMYSGSQIPAVGGSIGIERIFTILEAKLARGEMEAIPPRETAVFIQTVGPNLL